MKKLIAYYKSLRKKIAVYFTILLANRSYKANVKLADKLHKKNGEAYYIALAFNMQRLKVYNRSSFRLYKDFLLKQSVKWKVNVMLEANEDVQRISEYIKENRFLISSQNTYSLLDKIKNIKNKKKNAELMPTKYRDMNMTNLEGGCFYRTAYRGEKEPLDANTIEARRLAYINLVLRSAKLIEKAP